LGIRNCPSQRTNDTARGHPCGRTSAPPRLPKPNESCPLSANSGPALRRCQFRGGFRQPAAWPTGGLVSPKPAGWAMRFGWCGADCAAWPRAANEGVITQGCFPWAVSAARATCGHAGCCGAVGWLRENGHAGDMVNSQSPRTVARRWSVSNNGPSSRPSRAVPSPVRDSNQPATAARSCSRLFFSLLLVAKDPRSRNLP
jgi:hypothetical protein